MKIPRSYLLLSMLALSSVSCGSSVTDPGPGKRVTTELNRLTFQSGDTVTISVINKSDVQLTYSSGFCPEVLQRDAGGSWTDVPLSGEQGCALAIAYLGPYEQATATVFLPIDLVAGTYRILLPAPTVDISNPSLAEPPLITSAFTVSAR